MPDSRIEPGPAVPPLAVRWLSAAIGAFFIASAVVKAVAPWELRRALVYILPNGTPPLGIDFTVAGVTAWEAAIGALLLAFPRRKIVTSATLLTLLAYSAALARFAIDAAAPRCGCLAIPFPGVSGQRLAAFGLLRNAAMIWILIGAGWHSKHSWLDAGLTGRASLTRPTGFTMIELLLVIAVLAVLLALSLPALSSTRASSKTLRSLSTQRQLATLVNSYAADYSGSFPYFQTAGNPLGPMILPPGFALGPNHSYFMGGSVYWPNIMRSAYVAGAFADALMMDGDVAGSNLTEGFPADTIRCRFLLTHTVFADPLYWRAGRAPVQSALFRPIRVSDVLMPASKGMMFDLGSAPFKESSTRRAHEGQQVSVCRMDCSAGVVRWDHLDPKLVVSRGYGSLPWPILSSRDGVHGRDF